MCATTPPASNSSVSGSEEDSNLDFPWPDEHSRGSSSRSFLLAFGTALGLAILAATAIAPMAASMAAATGLRFPFPRIFDRVIMVTLFAALLIFARRLELLDLLRRGFRTTQIGVQQALGGLMLAVGGIGVLFAAAFVVGGDLRGAAIATSVLSYLPAAILIAVIEESFFRAFLLAGMERELGPPGALIVSSLIFALVHVMRSPARFYLIRFAPMAGAKIVAAYAVRMIHPDNFMALIGLFLLSLVLGEAFVLTGQVYCSLGLHIGFVLGAKTWRKAVVGTVPRWLAGSAPVPLIAAPAAWAISAVILALLPVWLRRRTYNQHAPSGTSLRREGESDG
jgi:membrane protease YdiL (CAAX protease family)